MSRNSPALPLQRIAIGTQSHTLTWLTGTQAGQKVLAEAHRSSQRPRCLCVAGGVEMYPAQRGRTFYLARMPGSGMLHDVACPSVDDVNLFSGIGTYASGTLLVLPDGRLQVRFDAAAPRQIEALAASLDGLLDLLLDTADLNASPMSATLGWESVRTALANAALSLVLNASGPLSALMLLPASFNKDDHERQRQEQEDYLSTAAVPRFVCAPLREIRPTKFGYQLILKHLPRTMFWISRAVASALEAGSGGTQSLKTTDYPALVLAQVQRTRGDGFTVTSLALRRTDRRFVPCLSDADVAAADELTQLGRQYLRPLRFDLPWDVSLCDYALINSSADAPTPIFILDSCGCAPLDKAKHEVYRVLASGSTGSLAVRDGNWTPQAPSPSPSISSILTKKDAMT